MATKPLPSQEILRQLLRYEPETGKLYWRPRPLALCAGNARIQKAWNSRCAEKEAFAVLSNTGYLQGSIYRTTYLTHRIIFKLVYGTEPAEIDHDNRIRTDNRIVNLFASDKAMNSLNKSLNSNSTSGVCGVRRISGSNKWEARISIDGKQISLGCFSTLTEAAEVRRVAQLRYGYRPNHGLPKPLSMLV